MKVTHSIELNRRRPPTNPEFTELATHSLEEKIIASAEELKDCVLVQTAHLEKLDGTRVDKDERPGHVRKESGNAPITEKEKQAKILDLFAFGTIGGCLAGAVGIATIGLTGGVAGMFVGGLLTVAALDRSGDGDPSAGFVANDGTSKVAEIFQPETNTVFRLNEKNGHSQYRKGTQKVTFESDRKLNVVDLELPAGDFVSLPQPNLNEYEFVAVAPSQESGEKPRSTSEYKSRFVETEVRERFSQACRGLAEFGVSLKKDQPRGADKTFAVYNGATNGGINGEMTLDEHDSLVSLHGTVCQVAPLGDLEHKLMKYDVTDDGSQRYFFGDELFMLKDGMITEFARPGAQTRKVTFYLDGIPVYSQSDSDITTFGR